MIRVQFNNQQAFRNVDFIQLSETSVFLEGKRLEANSSGFKAYRLNGSFLGDYSAYTLCEPSENGYIFTKDGMEGEPHERN